MLFLWGEIARCLPGIFDLGKWDAEFILLQYNPAIVARMIYLRENSNEACRKLTPYGVSDNKFISLFQSLEVSLVQNIGENAFSESIFGPQLRHTIP